MKKVTACVLLFLLGLALSAVPAVAHADTHAGQSPAQANANSVRKRYVKHQRKTQKRALKAQRRSTKNWRKQRQTASVASPK